MRTIPCDAEEPFIHSLSPKLYYRTLRSPQLLELSGIGRRDILDKINVPVQVDLPGVGENVQEHYFLPLSWGKVFLATILRVALTRWN